MGTEGDERDAITGEINWVYCSEEVLLPGNVRNIQTMASFAHSQSLAVIEKLPDLVPSTLLYVYISDC